MSEREIGTPVTDQVNVIYGPNAAEVAHVDEGVRQIAYQLQSWVNNMRAVTGQASLFDRGKYVSSDNVYQQMLTARAAVKDDDICASVADITEGMAFQGCKWESPDWDTTDLFNQMAAEQNLDGLMRKMWREEFTYSCCIPAFWWHQGEFVVRGSTEAGNKKKRKVKIWYPQAVTLLDPAKVVPVGLLAFGQERLAWRATRQETVAYNSIVQGELQDELMDRFFVGQYVARDTDELREITSLQVDPSQLLLLDDRYVARHTTTKPDYLRFADVRLRSVFRLLDLKQQLLESDRVALIGAANYILLVKKGDKDDPAYPEEIANLKDNYSTLAKLPVIFSDHRLNIEIISPKQEHVLNREKYETVDNRIAARLLNTLNAAGTSGQRSDNTLTVSRLIARSMEGRRHMLRRFLERQLARMVVEDPRNEGVFPVTPSLVYTPPNIQLDEDAGVAQVVQQARTTGDLSRESFLDYFGFDQEVEAMRVALEATKFDDIFQTRVPFDSPSNNDARSGPGVANKPAKDTGTAPVSQAPAGGSGGRPVGGGKAPATPTPPKPAAKTPVVKPTPPTRNKTGGKP
jgi:hypothetical protein